MKKTITFGLLITTGIFLLTFALQCKKDHSTDNPPAENPLTKIENTLGFGLLDKVKGIWNGPVTSSTPLGGYPEWIVDFRPISENQISAKNELDTLNSIHMSYFVAKYNNEYRVCFRNGGSFGGQTRVSYFLADSVSETTSQSYYRFAEIIKGRSRAYTEVIFRNDSLIMKSYTNKYNTLTAATANFLFGGFIASYESWCVIKQLCFVSTVVRELPQIKNFVYPLCVTCKLKNALLTLN